jgi:hypothetical protein
VNLLEARLWITSGLPTIRPELQKGTSSAFNERIGPLPLENSLPSHGTPCIGWICTADRRL